MAASIKLVVVFYLMSLFSISVYAQTTKVVVIPMAGDDIVGVEKTGQTLCYDPSGNSNDSIDCTGTDQDGETQIGTAWPNPRFTDNSDGTVTDNLTDLVWLKDANCYPDRSWADALIYANSIDNGKCGLTDGSTAGDWRLPNVRELHSLIDFNFFSPALSNDTGTGQWTSGSGSAFTGVQDDQYWSSSSIASSGSYAWVVFLSLGYATFNDKSSTSTHLWAVRSGQ